MSDENNPSVEEIKERLKVEIPIEEEPTAEEQEASSEAKAEFDLVGELNGIGRQFADTLRSVWDSEQRQKLETEVRDGLSSFVGEVDKMINDVRDGNATEKVKTEATNLKTEATNLKDQVNPGEMGQQAREGMAQGLRWFSQELGKLADQFTEVASEPSVEDVSAEIKINPDADDIKSA